LPSFGLRCYPIVIVATSIEYQTGECKQMKVDANPTPLRADLLWGCRAIADELGISQMRTFRLLEAGVLPARKLGGRNWVASRQTLREALTRADVPPDGGQTAA
jgi:hypothetical protein